MSQKFLTPGIRDRNTKFKYLMEFDIEQSLKEFQIKQDHMKRLRKVRKASHFGPMSPILKADYLTGDTSTRKVGSRVVTFNLEPEIK